MTTPREADLQALRAFLDTPLDVRLARARAADPEAHALGLAQRVAADVPAYAAFLRDHAVDPVAATRLADLPLKTKPGYVRAFPLADRARGGDLAASAMLAVSSGSTGEPVVWPRALRDELEVASRFEQVLRDAFHADARTTLAVVCFPLGTWVGGMFTAACLRHLALKGYPLTVATPGNKPDEILRVVADLRDDFDQTVLLGYPPFMKDVVDLGRERGLDWAARPTRLVFAGEVFSEAWRDLVCARVGADDPATATASLYGTADSGVLAVETPLSIAVRRFFAAHPDAARDTFGEARLPTLAQYDPLDRYFEVVPGELGDTLALTADGGAPLVRYHIADHGGVLGFDALLARVRDAGGDPDALVAAAGRGARDLPFVWVFGRADFTISFFGANVYPENVAPGLEVPPISDWCGGKFVLHVVHDDDHDAHLALEVELLPGVAPEPRMTAVVAESVTRAMTRMNSELAHYCPPARQTPRVTLHPHADPTWFPTGVKHRYTRRG